MNKTKIAGVGHYVPTEVYTNDDLAKYMETTDEWIQERTGIKERRFAQRTKETTTTLALEASKMAIDRAGIDKNDIDFIIFATISPDYYFPGCGVLLQRALGITGGEAGALDIRTQCTGFIYGLSIADQFIKTGMYKNILLVGSEMQSMGLELSTAGRNLSVIFGDGAGAVILQPAAEGEDGIYSTHLHADGTHAEELAMCSPGAHGGHYEPEVDFGYGDKPGSSLVTKRMIEDGHIAPYMNGKLVFKTAVTKFPEVINAALTKAKLGAKDIGLFIPHQANLRISAFVQKILGLTDDQVYNNIQKYGNTTAASIPIALSEAWEAGRVNRGDLICLAAFGSGFTWGSALLRW